MQKKQELSEIGQETATQAEISTSQKAGGK